jgi:5-oxoprolinase (ATP-hydrolysing)
MRYLLFLAKGKSHEELHVEKAIDVEEVKQCLHEIYQIGIRSIAVVFMHAYAYPVHEETVRDLALAM